MSVIHRTCAVCNEPLDIVSPSFGQYGGWACAKRPVMHEACAKGIGVQHDTEGECDFVMHNGKEWFHLANAFVAAV
jgi:hypothetical protein